ncbi:MAG: hypothetical protein IJA71_07545, partial [Clostridia bacterium]|nr:hypothetical protein [Clostridia bacterium]
PATDRLLEEDCAYLINTEPFRQRGFALSPEAREKLYGGNFRRFVGGEPVPVDPRLVKKECRRIATTLKIMSFVDKGLFPDYSVSKNAAAFFDKR